MKANQHNIVTPKGDHVHVMEVPNTFFNGIQVCLAVKSKEEIAKCRWMIPRFKKFLDEASHSVGSNIIVGASNVPLNRN